MLVLPPALRILLLLIAVPAAVYDIRSRRIPNLLVLIGLILGFGLNTFLYETAGLKRAALGMGLALLVYMPLYLIRAMGAGDAKLMAALGSIVGPQNWFGLFLLTAALGGLVGVVYLLARGGLRKALANSAFILHELAWFRAPHKSREELDVTSGKGVSLPHGAVICLAVFVYLTAEALWAPR